MNTNNNGNYVKNGGKHEREFRTDVQREPRYTKVMSANIDDDSGVIKFGAGDGTQMTLCLPDGFDFFKDKESYFITISKARQYKQNRPDMKENKETVKSE